MRAKSRLQANYNVDDISLEGSSNDFWVSPYKLIATAQSGGSNINGNSNTSSTKHKAGEVFDFTVTAYNSLGTEDGHKTLNFIPNNLQLLLTRTGPSSGGFDGRFSYETGSISSALAADVVYQPVSLNTFIEGVSSTNNATYSEVGLLNLDLQDVDYGFVGNTIVGDDINIGRFYPDHFEQTVASHGALDSVCNQNTSFAYTGQTVVDDPTTGAISYLANPVVELTAKNALGTGETTKNYTHDDYMKLNAAANFIVPTYYRFNNFGQRCAFIAFNVEYICRHCES